MDPLIVSTNEKHIVRHPTHILILILPHPPILHQAPVNDGHKKRAFSECGKQGENVELWFYIYSGLLTRAGRTLVSSSPAANCRTRYLPNSGWTRKAVALAPARWLWESGVQIISRRVRRKSMGWFGKGDQCSVIPCHFACMGFEDHLLGRERNNVYFYFYTNPSVTSSCVSQLAERVVTD